MKDESTPTEAWKCQYDGSIHRKGIHHDGDTPLVPETEGNEVSVVMDLWLTGKHVLLALLGLAAMIGLVIWVTR